MMEESIYLNNNVKSSVCSIETRYLTFKAGDLNFGVLITEIVQIIGIEKITPVPEFPHYAKGVILYQGDIVPIIDIRTIINETETKQSERSCMIIVRIDEIKIGIIADSVEWLGTLEEPIDPQESAESKAHPCVIGKAVHAGKDIVLVDLDKLLGCK